MDIAALQLKMRDAFRAEAADLLAELDSSMLELESRPQDADLLNRVFRAIHTIKGSGATAGFNEMAAFTHHVEELFDEARMGRLTITPEMIDLALKAKDLIGQFLELTIPACWSRLARKL
jgi:two-component system chemotaxis sensor kinase CheA